MPLDGKNLPEIPLPESPILDHMHSATGVPKIEILRDVVEKLSTDHRRKLKNK